MEWHVDQTEYDLARNLLNLKKEEYLGDITVIELNIGKYNDQIKDFEARIKVLEAKLSDNWGKVDKLAKAIDKLNKI